MIGENIRNLRKEAGWPQETLAEKLDVSRQTVAKWENGESSPDLEAAAKIAEVFGVSLDRLADVKKGENGCPPGKYIFGAVRVGERGQIIIPKKCRDVFGLEPGTMLLMCGDIDRGIALVKLGEEVFSVLEDDI